MTQGISLTFAFCPPTVRRLRYGAVEVMTNYTQFCIVQLIELVTFARCVLSLTTVDPCRNKMPYTHLYIYICVGHKVWICAIHGLHCANHGSVLCEGNFVLYTLRYARSMDCRVKYGSMVCTAQSVDCANPYFVPNIYM